MKVKFAILLVSCFMLAETSRAQNVAVKTNLLYDATATVNLGAEIGLSPRWTLDLSGNYNGWTFSRNRKWKHWLVQPEARYWLCDRMMGHFFSFHLVGGQYNVGNLANGIKFLGTDLSPLGNYRYQGWFVGAGVAYGYTWALSRHWNIEAEIGVGYAYSKYDKFECAECGEKIGNGDHHYVGPTKAAINLVYVF